MRRYSAASPVATRSPTWSCRTEESGNRHGYSSSYLQMQVREIRDLPIHAELVTLSACDTGNGRLLGEEGIASLERAFLLAGGRHVHDRLNETVLRESVEWHR